jgi:hypothetical protein
MVHHPIRGLLSRTPLGPAPPRRMRRLRFTATALLLSATASFVHAQEAAAGEAAVARPPGEASLLGSRHAAGQPGAARAAAAPRLAPDRFDEAPKQGTPATERAAGALASIAPDWGGLAAAIGAAVGFMLRRLRAVD